MARHFRFREQILMSRKLIKLKERQNGLLGSSPTERKKTDRRYSKERRICKVLKYTRETEEINTHTPSPPLAGTTGPY